MSTTLYRIGFCSVCKKKMRKTKKFTTTTNEADKWRPDFIHEKCQQNNQPGANQ